MSRPCPGGCGHRLYDCCDQAVGEPHQTRCRTRTTRAIRVDGRPTIHKAYLDARFGDGQELVCVGGCDLRAVVCYEFVDERAGTQRAALCPAWLVPTDVPTDVAAQVATAGEDDPTVDHIPVTKE